MKNLYLILALFFSGCFFDSEPFEQKSQTPTVTVVQKEIKSIDLKSLTFAIGEYPPYISSQFDGYGVIPTLVARAFARKGYSVEFEFFPWKRAYVLAANGTFDGTLAWESNPENDNLFLHGQAFLSEPLVFFYLDESDIVINMFADVAKYRLGVIRGYDYSPEFGSLRDTLKLEDVKEGAQAFEMLLNKRTDLYLSGLRVGRNELATFFPKHSARVRHTSAFYVYRYYLINLSKKVPRNSALLQLFDESIVEMKESGEYDKIISRYLE